MSTEGASSTRANGQRAWWKRYGVAALAVLDAFIVLIAFPALVEAPGTIQLLLSFSVLVAAWYGGLGPGLFAAAAILLITWPAEVSTANLMRVLIFTAQGLLCSALMESLHRSRKTAVGEAAVRRASEVALSGEIMARNRLEDELRRQAEALRETSRRKDEFLAMLAHELRNPLAALSGAAAIAARSSDPDDLEWSRNAIERNIKQLARLIDDLLDVSRVTQGKVELRKEEFEMSSAIDQAVDSIQYLLATKGHQIAVSLERGSLWVDADSARLQQVVACLLTNAIQYSEEGSYIRLRAHRQDGEVLISVRDQGQGIGPELLPHVFDLFKQGDRSLARTEGGLGIGLTMVKALAELHGGSVSAASEGKGRGSEFVVRLPAARRAQPAALEPFKAPGAKRSANRILVVDDNVDLSRALTTLLSRFGYEAQAVNDGQTAIEAARALRPEVVLLDLGLPGIDGYEVARRLRREEGVQDATIIAITGYGQEDGGRYSREEGFNHHLIKPVQIEALVELLERSG
jgi:signal transduction histidine kinase